MHVTVHHSMEVDLTPCLLDSNILVYANNVDAPLHEPGNSRDSVCNCDMWESKG